MMTTAKKTDEQLAKTNNIIKPRPPMTPISHGSDNGG